jgi:uncharacterized repeat protein (TIGR03803 family)
VAPNDIKHRSIHRRRSKARETLGHHALRVNKLRGRRITCRLWRARAVRDRANSQHGASPRVGASCGTVFSITPSGSEKVLHSFSGPPDGAFPAAGLINVNGTLYGTTREGGDSGGCRLGEPKIGCGTVYSITPSGSENVIYRLVGPATGSDAVASLIDVNGTLYGTTEYGGGGHGPGTVYTVSPSGSGKLLYHFTYKEDVGEAPTAALIDAKGLLYGTASYAGMHGQGTVFSITNDRHGEGGVQLCRRRWRTTLRELDQREGYTLRHNLYGRRGQLQPKLRLRDGLSVTPSGTEQVLHSFSDSGDGYSPLAGLVNVNGTLYGTTSWGGKAWGTIYAITP